MNNNQGCFSVFENELCVLFMIFGRLSKETSTDMVVINDYAKFYVLISICASAMIYVNHRYKATTPQRVT